MLAAGAAGFPKGDDDDACGEGWPKGFGFVAAPPSEAKPDPAAPLGGWPNGLLCAGVAAAGVLLCCAKGLLAAGAAGLANGFGFGVEVVVVGAPNGFGFCPSVVGWPNGLGVL